MFKQDIKQDLQLKQKWKWNRQCVHVYILKFLKICQLYYARPAALSDTERL